MTLESSLFSLKSEKFHNNSICLPQKETRILSLTDTEHVSYFYFKKNEVNDMGKSGSISSGSAVIIIGLLVLVLIFSGVLPIQLKTTQPQYTPTPTPTATGTVGSGLYSVPLIIGRRKTYFLKTMRHQR